MNTIKKTFVCLAPFWFYIFDLALMLFGVKYGGAEDSPLLVMLGVLVLGIVGLIYLAIRLRTMQITITELCFLAVTILFILLYLLTGDSQMGKPLALLSYIRRSVLYCFITFFSFIIIQHEKWYRELFETVRWFALAATAITAFRMMPQLSLGFKAIQYYGSLRYQSMGYRCTIFAVLLEIYVPFCKKMSHRLLYITGIAVNFIALIMTGARGAMIAFILVTGFVVLASIRKFSISQLLRFAAIALAAGAVAIGVVFAVPALRGVFLNATRSFNYITDSGINLDNRSDIFAQAVSLILQAPLMGYGFGAAYHLLGIHPHNLFLEFMIDGGIFYTTGIVILMLVRLWQWMRCFRANWELRDIFVMILVNLSMLLLSTSYYTNPWIWLFFFINPNRALAGVSGAPTLEYSTIEGD